MSDPLLQSPLGSRFGALTLGRVLGKGASAVVYDSRTESGAQYAVRVIRTSPGHSNARCRRKTIKEISIHTLVSSHPNVVSLLDVFPESSDSQDDAWPYTYIVLPFASSGDLYSRIIEHQTYLNDSLLIRAVFLQILSAVQHCHSLGVFHRDIKSENILTFDDGRRVMLADFGLATKHTRSREWGVGTRTYMSPECIGEPYGPEDGYSSAATDTWSLGILLINLLTGRNPWHKATSTDTLFVQYCHDPNNYLMHALPISWQAHAVLRRILVAEEYRVSITTLMANVATTREWYDVDAVFEGAMARWREPGDRVDRNGRVCSDLSAQGSTSGDLDQVWTSWFSNDSRLQRHRSGFSTSLASSCSTHPAPPLVVRNGSARRSESCESSLLPPLTSAPSQAASMLLPETPPGVELADVQVIPQISEAEAEAFCKECQGEPLHDEATKTRVLNRLSRPLRTVSNS